MNSFQQIKARADKVLCKTYSRYPVGVERALGSRIWDFDGREYIDLLAGISVCSLGHCHPEIARVVDGQVRKLVHVSNLFYQEEQVLLAEKLTETCHCSKVFFCNSGAEANEAAIKLARRFFQKCRGEDRHTIITLSNCFHGRTLATIAASGQERLTEGFMPLPQGFITVAAGALDEVAAAINSSTAAVMLEVVQGEGGVKLLDKDFVQGVARLTREKGILLIIDEVQAGMGRSGKWWGFQHYGIEPDIFTSAKALANGIPMGAMLCTEEVANGFDFGSHGSTFGGNALAARTARAVLEIMQRDRLPEHAADLGAWAVKRFRQVAAKHPGKIAEVRGLGLFIGIELTFAGKEVWGKLIDKGFILNLTQEKVLRLLPALNIERKDLEAFALALEEVLQ